MPPSPKCSLLVTSCNIYFHFYYHHQQLAKKLEDLIYKKYQTRNIGFHFNLNGGQAIDYVSAGGIKANRGADIGVQFGDRTAEVREQVYFFSTKNMSLYEIVNMDNMKSIFSKKHSNIKR